MVILSRSLRAKTDSDVFLVNNSRCNVTATGTCFSYNEFRPTNEQSRSYQYVNFMGKRVYIISKQYVIVKFSILRVAYYN